ncbi:DUF3466 family protein [Pseudidiomarina sediminum]|uniref:DUF3466 family protein n=1 Tax=Pseudidiomarina sediminum TaxID=431675 RepID=UPI001C943F3E|nr:DUF3466 family protein [Pseudidiomarina sediminum]MBY6063081.1 DUF3466 family protein [Pseudidiomarina sediminum]
MKHFNLGVLGVAIASAMLSNTAQADAYSFQKVETPDSVLHLYPAALNDNRHSIALGQFPLDLQIDLTQLSDATLFGIGIDPEDEDLDLTTYELSDGQYKTLVNNLRDARATQTSNPRLSYYYAGFYNGQQVDFEAFFEDPNATLPQQTGSTDHFYYGLNNNDVRVGWGTAPYRFIEFTYTAGEGEDEKEITTTFSERDFTRQAIWTDGVTTRTYEAPEQSYLGGESVMMDINDHNVAVGYVSTGLSPQAVEFAESCQTSVDEGTATRPVNICMWQRWHNLSNAVATNLQDYYSRLTIGTNQSIYDMRAIVWQLDGSGNVISSQQYEPLMERSQVEDQEDSADFSTYAYAVNNNGIAVGQSWTYYEGEPAPSRRIKMPVVFIDGETRAITDSNEYYWGSATDINDNNQVVGFLIKRIQGVQRYVGFMYDIDTDTFNELPGFFVGSSTIPTAINNAGEIVGTAEIEPTLSNQRRRVGFFYASAETDANFINLNDAVGCEAGVFIATADGINNNSEIVATNVQPIERTDTDGTVYTEQVGQMIVLDPTGGEISNCSEEETRVERQGASTGIVGMLGMFLIGGLITLRRRFKV